MHRGWLPDRRRHRRRRLRRYRGARIHRAGSLAWLNRSSLVLLVAMFIGLAISYSIFDSIHKRHFGSLKDQAEQFEFEVLLLFDGWETAARSYGSLWLSGFMEASELETHLRETDLSKHIPGMQWLAILSGEEEIQSFVPALPRSLQERLLLGAPTRDAMEMAAATGDTVTSRTYPAVAEGCEGKAVARVFPVVQDKGLPAERHRGWVVSGFCIQKIFSRMLQRSEPTFSVEVYEGELAAPLLQRSLPMARMSLPLISSTRTVDLGGAKWRLEFRSLPFPFGWQAGVPILLAIATLGASFLLYSLTRSEARGRLLAEEMIEGFRSSQRRARFIADASRLLAAQRSSDGVLFRLAKKAIPLLGSGCGICLLDDEKNLRIIIAHSDPAVEKDLRDTFSNVSIPHPSFAALLMEMEKNRLRRIPHTLFESHLIAPFPLELQEPCRKALKWCLIIPLVARGRPIGGLAVRMWEDRRYGSKEIGLIHDFASRLAMSLDNTRLLEESQEAIRIREEFLSIASHELLTPLTSIQAHVQGLQRIQKTGNEISPERLERGLDVINRQILRLSKLVRELLDVSRIRAGRLFLHRERLDLSELTREFVRRYQGEAERSGSTLEVLAPVGAFGSWDRHRLEQVITNLLSNAIKYGRGGPILVCTEFDEDQARISFRDEGMGIPQDFLGRIFHRFERAVLDQSYGGLGLGLFIANQIVEAHGGSIHVQSEVGVGSTFTVYLPREIPDAEPASTHPIEFREAAR